MLLCDRPRVLLPYRAADPPGGIHGRTHGDQRGDRRWSGHDGQAGQFVQEADSVVITNLRQTAWATTAASFTLNGLTLAVDSDGTPEECF